MSLQGPLGDSQVGSDAPFASLSSSSSSLLSLSLSLPPLLSSLLLAPPLLHVLLALGGMNGWAGGPAGRPPGVTLGGTWSLGIESDGVASGRRAADWVGAIGDGNAPSATGDAAGVGAGSSRRCIGPRGIIARASIDD